MIEARRVSLDIRYNNAEFAGEQVGTEIESLTYTDNAADNSDSLDLTINAQDKKWLNAWLPETGATIKARIIGKNWDQNRRNRSLNCGLFTLDDIAYKQAPGTMTIGAVSKPAEGDFSELERETIWQNTSVKRIGETIAERYGLPFSYDADDYEIDCDEQDATDSKYYNTLCKRYGLVLKVYARRLWVYDREKYKAKRPVRTFAPLDIKPGSMSYSTTLSGTFTGGTFTYTDPDRDIDISCSVGGGTHTKNLNQRAVSVQDAAAQLCAAINNENHGKEKLKFTVEGAWNVCAGNCINLSGCGKISGKYFVDRVTHKYSRKNGFTSDINCSRVTTPFYAWDVGGTIEYHENEDAASEGYNDNYERTEPAASAASSAAGGKAGQAVTLRNAPFYYSSTAAQASAHYTGVYYFYDGILINGRYRITNSADRCGKLPIGENCTGWVPASYCVIGGGGGGGPGKAFADIL